MQSESHVNELEFIDRTANDNKCKVNVLFKRNTMGVTDLKYKFHKTACHEFGNGKSETVCAQLDRYICIYVFKKPGSFDKEKFFVRITVD